MRVTECFLTTDGDLTDDLESKSQDLNQIYGFAIQATVSLVDLPAVAASRTIQNTVYTAVTAGVGGNSITIVYLDPGGNNQALSVSVVTNAITVHLATNGGGTITSTNDLIAAAILASAPAHALVTSVVGGGHGSDVVTAVGSTALQNGADPTPGEVAGTLKLQACNDDENYVDVEDSSFVIDDAGTTVWNYDISNFKFVKAVWVDGGTEAGSIDVLFFGRGF